VCGSSGSCELTSIAGCPVAPPAGGGGTGSGGSGNGGTGSTGTGSTGTGNNGNGASGCAGGNCSQGGGHVAEVCGDCVDNDGDGLADYEDPDCCERIDPLTLGRMLLRSRPQASGDTLRLRSRPSPSGAAGLDAVRAGATLQLSDRDGGLYCQNLALVTTKRGLKRGVFRFKDRAGTLAAGLQRARLKIGKDGRIVFRAAGAKMHLRTPAESGVTVTLRAGGQCMQANALLRNRPTKVGTRNTYP
jgi:hypothetical protein